MQPFVYLFAFEEALLVTVGDVQRERQDPWSVLHALNDIIQFSPAGPLHTDTGVSVPVVSVCVRAPELKIENLWNSPEIKNEEAGNSSCNEDFIYQFFGISLCSHHVVTCEGRPAGHLGWFVRISFFPVCKTNKAWSRKSIWDFSDLR